MIFAWTGAYCVFAVEAIFKTGESVIATQGVFRAHFMLYQNDAILDRKVVGNSIQNSITLI